MGGGGASRKGGVPGASVRLERVMDSCQGWRLPGGGSGKRTRRSAAPPKLRIASRSHRPGVETAMPTRNRASRPSGAARARSRVESPGPRLPPDGFHELPIRRPGVPRCSPLVGVLQYGSKADDFGFEDSGASINVSPSNYTSCDQQVNQAASDSYGW